MTQVSPRKLELSPHPALVVSARSFRPRVPAKLLLLLAWTGVALSPMMLQIKSFVQLATPHKVSKNLIAQLNAPQLTDNLTERCPMTELKIAGAFWNIYPTHYYSPRMHDDGIVCGFIVGQYNIFGSYHIHEGNNIKNVRTTTDCGIVNSSRIEYFFYHGSVGYYSYYEEGVGTYCSEDQTGYVKVGELGTFDINGNSLVQDRGGSGDVYRRSYYYQTVELIWILFRVLVVRRSLLMCLRFGKHCDGLGEELSLGNAIIFAHESARLTSHRATNYQRLLMIYFLVESLMGDLFFLIAKEGLFAKIQYVSLGYNLAGFISVAFEIVESKRWLGRYTQTFKRVLFNFEGAMCGEFFCAGMVSHFLTAVNRSEMKRAVRAAEAVSHYVWGLVGHAVLVLGFFAAIVVTRIVVTLLTVRVKYGSLRVLIEPCCVETLLGTRQKIVMLVGYIRENGHLLYSSQALTSFGLMSAVDWNHNDFLVHYRVDWFTQPKRRHLVVVGALHGSHLESCPAETSNDIASSGLVTFYQLPVGATATV